MPASKLDLVPGGAAGALDGADRVPVVQGPAALTNEDANGEIVIATLDDIAAFVSTEIGTAYSRTLIDDADAATARGTLGLGTAAVATIGTSGDTVPKNNTANTFSAATIITLTTTAIPLSVVSTDAGAGAAPHIEAYRDSASPANGDDGPALRLSMKDDGGNKIPAVEFRAQILDVAAASKDTGAQLYVYIANTQTREWQIRDGTIFGNPTGGHKGTGTLNAATVYDDNSALTCMALQREFIERGEVDLAKWDALVPDQVIPEARRWEPVTREVKRLVVRRSRDGDYSAGVEMVDEPVIDLVPVWDGDGNGVTAVEEPQLREVVTPARTVVRRHETAHRFAAMVADGFDPRSPAAYIARLKADQSLPGMPTAAEWQHNGLSTGELFCRLWLATELLALVVIDHEARIAALEAATARRG